MWRPHPEYLALGTSRQSRMSAYRQLFAQQVSTQFITGIREALHTGLVLGNDRFKQEVKKLTGQRQHHLKRGAQPR